MSFKPTYQAKNSIYFDGADQYLEIANQGAGVANLNPTQAEAFSITSWVYGASSGLGGTYRPICANQESVSPYEGFFFGFYAGKLRLSFYDLAPSQHYVYDNVTTFQASQWHFVAATFSGNSNTSGMKLYANGAELTTTVSGAGAIGTVASSGATRVGSTPWSGTGGSDMFLGFISNVGFWNAELSAAQVTEVYRGRTGNIGPGDLNHHSASANLLSWWIADNPSDAYNGTIYDEKSSYNLTANNLDSDAIRAVAP